MTFEENIELICTYLAVCELTPMRVRNGLNVPGPSFYDLLEPMWSLEQLPWSESIDAPGIPLVIRPWPGMDVCIAAGKTSWLTMRRFRCLPPIEVRHLRYAHYTLSEWASNFDRDGVARTGYADLLSQSSDGLRWRGAKTRVPLTQDEAMVIRLAIGLAWRRSRTWRVALGFEDAPRIDFETTATGIREVFALRDVPNGKKRRAALRHWVSGYWRGVTRPSEDAVWVRKHLRGAEDFVWNGLRANIRVPTEDAEDERLKVFATLGAEDA